MTSSSRSAPRSPATALEIGAPSNAAPAVTGRLAGLDGLRGVAVTLVLVYHLFPPLWPGGFIGVDVFFVISGFLITGLIVAEHDRTGRFVPGRFWRHRARRLLPPLVPVVLVASTVAWLIGGDVLVGLGAKLLGAATFSYNWMSLLGHSSYFGSDQPELFRNLWSLAVEEQFYLLWPLLLLGLLRLRRPGLRLAFVGGLAVASAAWMAIGFGFSADPTRVYYGTDTHSFGLLIGTALALLVHSRRSPGTAQTGLGTSRPVLTGVSVWLGRARPWLGGVALAGVIGGAVWLPADAAVTYRGGLLTVSVLSAVVIWAGIAGGRFGRTLDAAPLRYLGGRSYALYLWHWPVLVLIQLLAPFGPDAIMANGGLSLLIALAAAEVSYRWLESPVRRLGLRGSHAAVWRRLRGTTAAPAQRPKRTLAAVSAVTAAALLLLAGTTAAVALAPTMTSAQAEVVRGEAALARAKAAAAEQAEADVAARAAGEAVAATRGSTMTAVGDSVMLAAAAELQAEFPGISIDAQVSRGMAAAPDILTALRDAGHLRRIVVVGLGTNGPVERSDLTAILRVIGPSRELVVVNAFADRDWTPGVNATLAHFSAQRGRVVLADWSDAIAPHVDVLADDGIHPGPTGGAIYADAVAAAVDGLAASSGSRGPGVDTLQAFRVRPQ